MKRYIKVKVLDCFGDGKLRKFLIASLFSLSKSAKDESRSQEGWPRF